MGIEYGVRIQMLDYKELEKTGKECGFTHVGMLDTSTIHLLKEVRDMCSQDSCHMYGKNWCCPPGCGTLEECEKKIRKYTQGILVQTVGELEDELDGEGMMETEARHKENFDKLREELLKKYPGMLSIGSGCCTRCKVCTYPDAPCRFPDHSFASMEAYGMLVTRICEDNNMVYYYGPGTISYTSCFLLE